MKLWEVLKALEENPKKVFTCNHMGKRHVIKADKNGYMNLEIYAGTGELISPKAGGGAFNGNMHISKMDWQALVIPVTWQEAIEAWANGKTIRCKHSVSVYEYHDDADGFGVMEDQDGNPPSKLEMLEGTWYIEEESK